MPGGLEEIAALQSRIEQLEAELAATRQAAVHMMVGMAMGIASTPEGREDLAEGFSEAANDPDPVIARLADDLAAALRAAIVLDEE
ncbi:hypothetical protein [Paracoccus siganidrum]|uniref:Uncharacterized protein n=1 Tax=Paracoccus siganidrum TaxID=1276757 RepID=A0A419A6T2_9RHOB|nr:hypothetical protein [Paracoccus siganidrum]RJL15288.1 hypothetical protein D3P05_10775 [Paracoccus siganidrum]RMC39348.1 hypothetical protein C9E82_05055 [Paracoccus siganidrum]